MRAFSLALVLVMMTPARTLRAFSYSCTVYCKYVSKDQHATWRPKCNCSLPQTRNVQEVNQETRQWFTSRPNMFYDPTSAFYGPTKSEDDETFNYKNRSPPTFAKYKPRRSVSNDRRIYNKENIRKIHIVAEELPIYLDIDIHKPTNQDSTEESVLKSRLKDVQLIENLLSECIHLHNIAHLRKTKLNTIIVDQYKHVSEFDLNAKIKEKCDLPSDIVEISLKEIKENIFGTHDRTGFSEEGNYNWFPELDTVADRQGKRYDKSIESFTVANDKTTALLDSSTGNIENSRYIAIAIHTKVSVVTDNHNFNNMESTLSTTINDSNEILNGKVNKVQTVSGVPNLSALSNIESTLKDDTSDLPDDIRNIDGQDYVTKHNANVEFTSSHTESIVVPDYSDELVPTRDVYNDQFASSTTSPVANMTDDLFLNTSYTGMHTTANHFVNRSTYLEGEYPIPYIVTKEYSNGTLVSNIDGDVSMDNSDSTTVNNLIKDISSPIGKECVDSANCLANFKSDKANAQEILTDPAIEVKGKMFFQYGQYFIPARFVQKSDGEISLSLDGLAICKHDKRSPLISALCNSLQSRNCTQA